MTAFNIDLITDQPDRLYVDVDRRLKLVIERTTGGLALHVYPRTVGVLWDAPFTTFEIDEADILALEQDMGE